MCILLNYIAKSNIPAGFQVAALLGTGAVIVAAGLLYALLRLLAERWVPSLMKRTGFKWGSVLARHNVFHRLTLATPGLLAHILAGAWMGPGSPMAAVGSGVQTAASLWMLLLGMTVLFALLDSLMDIYKTFSFASQLPIRSFIQVVKLVAFLAALLIAISALMGKSPALLVSGLGAMTAVLMLVFKDPILGFVAGIQLSANRMLSVGDWLEMPKYNADGDVIEVSLTTVKVRNWDQTITTIPTYALIADSFKNWRGMQEIGGRRIKRSLFIDMNSIRFLTPEDIEGLKKARLLTDYIIEKTADIESTNSEQGTDPSCPMNKRQMTNVGTFRAYLGAYLKTHPGIHQGLIMMVRQLQPTSAGLPIEVYAFTRDTAWVAHEGVQADLFDHILAIVPEFGLRVFQSPSGGDLQALSGRIAGSPPPVTTHS